MLMKLCKKKIHRLQRLIERGETEEEMKPVNTGKTFMCCFSLLHLCLTETTWGNEITFLHSFVSILVFPL